jgi:hypothetical protein
LKSPQANLKLKTVTPRQDLPLKAKKENTKLIGHVIPIKNINGRMAS